MISPDMMRRYAFFAGFPEATLRDLARIGQERKFKAGARLFEESGKLPAGERFPRLGPPASELMIVTQGEVELLTVLSSGKQVFVLNALPGDLVALSSLLDPPEYLFTAVARTDGSLVSFDAEKLHALCDQDNALGYRLMRRIANDLRNRLGQVAVQLAGMS